MTNSRKKDKPDVLIMGGGPAGLSAFQWCKELGQTAVLVERNPEFGGQLLSIYNPINNYLGRTAENGRAMLAHFLSQIKDLERSSVLNNSVVEFDPHRILATFSDGEIVQARAAIIATGIRRRQLGVPGEREFAGRGILESGARDKMLVGGKRVAIVGGGDAALENALILSEFAEKVYVIHRRSEFSARAGFIEPAINNARIEFVLDSIVSGFEGNDSLESIEISTLSTRRSIDIDAALIRIGVQPNSEIFIGKIDLDDAGYIKIDHLGATNVRDVYAVGDVACPKSPTIQSSTGTAATATKAINSLIYKH